MKNIIKFQNKNYKKKYKKITKYVLWLNLHLKPR